MAIMNTIFEWPQRGGEYENDSIHFLLCKHGGNLYEHNEGCLSYKM